MWGRGRVTQVLPRAGSTPPRRALGACGRLSAARSRFAAVSQTHAVDAKEGRLASDRVDLLDEPLK